jgi:hypothetical protein
VNLKGIIFIMVEHDSRFLRSEILKKKNCLDLRRIKEDFWCLQVLFICYLFNVMVDIGYKYRRDERVSKCVICAQRCKKGASHSCGRGRGRGS